MSMQDLTSRCARPPPVFFMALEPVPPLQGAAKTFHTDEVFGREARLTHTMRNEVPSVNLMLLPNLFPQRSRDGILPAGGLFAIKQGESYDTSFLQ